MKFTLSWLYDHLETEATLEDILYALTDLGLEVEEVSNPGDRLKDFTIGKVITAEKHPDADKLRVCQVSARPRSCLPHRRLCRHSHPPRR